MVQNTIQKMAKSIGYDIGLTDNIAQADLLNGFSEGILNSIKEKSGFETQVVGKKDVIAKSIAAAMADNTDMRDVIVEACKAYAAHSLVEKFGGSHE